MTQKDYLFESLNDTFDKIYIISLRRSLDRHRLIEKNFDGLDYELFWGSDARELDFERLKHSGLYVPETTLKNNITNKELEKGEVGCALSHIRLYEEILNSGYNKVLIFEDDAYFDAEDSNPAIYSLKNRPDDWEFLYLGYNNCQGSMPFKSKLRAKIAYPVLNFFGLGPYNAARLQNKYYKMCKNGWDYPGFVSGAYAYGISAAGAEKLINFQTPIIMAQDNAIGLMIMDKKLSAYRLRNPVFSPNREIPSTIEGRWD